MRILIVDHFYGAFIDSLYRSDQSLGSRSYDEQRDLIDRKLFGESVFECAALRALGHEASDSLVNIRPLQAAWMREIGGRILPDDRWGWRLRRGFVPWPRRSSERWIGEALLAQVRAIRPDVVHIQCVDLLGAALIKELRPMVRLVVGQIAAPLDHDSVLAPYHLVVSSLPNFVARFRAAGLDSEWLPLAFEPSLVEVVGKHDRDVRTSFVGSLSPAHRGRIAFLESVASRTKVAVWTADAAHLALDSPLREDLKGPAWGKQMYEVMARSNITVNCHIDVAAGYANNLRLYEATGMGAMLMTDQGANLSDLFEIGREVVTFGSAEDCAEKIQHYVNRPDESSAIAMAGQARTLREHTWKDRMQRLDEMIKKRL